MWQYFEAKRNLVNAEKALEKGHQKIKNLEEKIAENSEVAKQLDLEIENITANNESVS